MLLAALLPGSAAEGLASTYVDTRVSCPGRKYDAAAMTAASTTLPCGALAEVRNLENDLAVVVTIVDDGPHVRGRIIDLTPAAAARIKSDGLPRVRVTSPPPRAEKRAAGASSAFERLWRSRVGF